MSEIEFHEKDYHSKFNWDLWKKIFDYIMAYRFYVISLGVVIMAIAAVDAILPLMTKTAIDEYIVPGKWRELKGFAAIYAVIIAIQAINVWFLIVLAGKVELGVGYEIRKAGFAKLQELSLAYFNKTPVGWLMTRMTSDCERLCVILSWGLVDLIWGITMMIAISMVMIYLNWKLALITLIVVPPLLWISGKFQKLILHSYRNVRSYNSRVTGAFNEGILGVKTSKSLAREKENSQKFQKLTGNLYSSSCQAAFRSSLYLPVVLVLGTIGSALALWLGGEGVIAGAVTYGTLVAFISYSRSFFDPIQNLARIFAELQNAQAAAERIFSMIETEPQIKDTEEAKKRRHEQKKIIGTIDFVDVHFSYGSGKPILRDFYLSVRAGETIALVGETGSGKSTIANLVCRFYQPDSGKIMIDHRDYKNYTLDFLQSNLGVVLQDPYLFNGTVAENIRYGKLSATDEEVERAARIVSAHDFIMKLEQKYDTSVGEGGNLLSAGQKQLISFARALLADPSIFIMDEATSSVDSETEHLIQKAIEEILPGRTSFIIAHRLSTIRKADRILVLSDGRIIEQGNHRQLLAQKRHYHKLYTQQFEQIAV